MAAAVTGPRRGVLRQPSAGNPRGQKLTLREGQPRAAGIWKLPPRPIRACPESVHGIALPGLRSRPRLAPEAGSW